VRRLQQNYWNPVSAVRIEAYRTATGRDLVVYVPGTQSFLPGSKNPLNIPSNLTAMGNVAKAPSQQAVEDALKHLEAGHNDRVLFVGHSQGALIAGNIAEGATPYQVMGLVSLGGPISHLNLEVPVIAIQHDSDPVPSLSGGVNPMRENWVTVSSSQSFDSLVDAHKISSYAATALELAGSQDEGYRRVSKLMATQGDVGVEYLFELSLD
jgi:pimeloyl-ACP methyl ester carboxylesterase